MKKIIASIAVFFTTFLIYHIGFGCRVFPVDETTNTLQAPAWYPIIGIALAAGVAVLFSRRKAILFKIKLKVNPKAASEDLLGIKYHKSAEQLRLLYPKAVELYQTYGYINASILEIKLKISWENGKELIKWMEQDGIIPETVSSDAVQTADPFIAIDLMEGHDFEYWCADLLRRSGFAEVEVTPGSGDQGVDVIAVKDGIRYAIQCKRYSSDLGNTPIQEVSAGKVLYRCQVGVVMTNQHFTAGAKELAEATGTLLWDRDKLSEMLKTTVQQ